MAQQAYSIKVTVIQTLTNTKKMMKMLLVTEFPNEAEKFYAVDKDNMNEALLVILKKGWKKFFSKWDRSGDPQALRIHFVQAAWDMATMDEALFNQLPESIQKQAAGHRQQYAIGLERLARKVEVLKAAKTIVEADKDEALKMTTVVNGKKKALVAVVAEELNELLKIASNDGYDAFGLYEVRKTEKF